MPPLSCSPERLDRYPAPAGDNLVENCLGVDPNLVLRVVVGTEREEVQQVVQVYLPVELGVVVDRQYGASKLASNPSICGFFSVLLVFSLSKFL